MQEPLSAVALPLQLTGHEKVSFLGRADPAHVLLAETVASNTTEG